MQQERAKRGFKAQQQNQKDAAERLERALKDAEGQVSSALQDVGTLRLRVKAAGGAGAAFDPEVIKSADTSPKKAPGGSTGDAVLGKRSGSGQTAAVADDVVALQRRLKHTAAVLQGRGEHTRARESGEDNAAAGEARSHEGNSSNNDNE